MIVRIIDRIIETAPARNVTSYEDAWLHCLTCTHNGHYDWRLPTVDEWQQSSSKKISLEAYYDNEWFFSFEPDMQKTVVPVRVRYQFAA
jgi:hypothetical protein